MNYRLALDIGTASCGLIALALDDNREPVTIAHHSLSIFSEPVLPHAVGEAGEPKKAKRRRARLARRVIDRRARRLRRIAQLANLIGLDHETIPADKIEKRIDHRHHLIDALVIAQTSRSLYQRMAKHYKALAERRQTGEPVRMKLFVEPPIGNVREQALELVRNAEIRHKRDRYASGNFFQQTAYRKTWTDEGRSRAVIRIPLIQLTDAKGSLEKARKGISDIVSDHTKRIVSEAFENAIRTGKTAKEALSTTIHDSQFRTNIKRVAVYQRLGRGFMDGSSTYPIEHGSGLIKHYVSDGYAYVSLIESEGRVVTADSVPVFRAHRTSQKLKNGERRFFRGDTLLSSSSGKKYVIHQLLANAAVRVAEVTESRSWIELGAESGAAQFSASTLASMKQL